MPLFYGSQVGPSLAKPWFFRRTARITGSKTRMSVDRIPDSALRWRVEEWNSKRYHNNAVKGGIALGPSINPFLKQGGKSLKRLANGPLIVTTMVCTDDCTDSTSSLLPSLLPSLLLNYLNDRLDPPAPCPVQAYFSVAPCPSHSSGRRATPGFHVQRHHLPSLVAFASTLGLFDRVGCDGMGALVGSRP